MVCYAITYANYGTWLSDEFGLESGEVGLSAVVVWYMLCAIAVYTFLIFGLDWARHRSLPYTVILTTRIPFLANLYTPGPPSPAAS